VKLLRTKFFTSSLTGGLKKFRLILVNEFTSSARRGQHDYRKSIVYDRPNDDLASMIE